MNVASLELCKELYGLSGWEDTEFIWYEDYSKPVHIEVDVKSYDEAPAYDLGYLLRKLPEEVLLRKNGDKSWDIRWVETSEQFLDIREADTPEDAACRLAIELFKQGVLLPNLQESEK